MWMTKKKAVKSMLYYILGWWITCPQENVKQMRTGGNGSRKVENRAEIRKKRGKIKSYTQLSG